nr:spore coat protein CotJB [Paenibacillus donghaensis]
MSENQKPENGGYDNQQFAGINPANVPEEAVNQANEQSLSNAGGERENQPYVQGVSMAQPNVYGVSQPSVQGVSMAQPNVYGVSQPSVQGVSMAQPNVYGVSQPSVQGVSMAQPNVHGVSQPSVQGASMSQPNVYGVSQANVQGASMSQPNVHGVSQANVQGAAVNQANVQAANVSPEMQKGAVDQQYYELLERLQMIDFALVELNLYLDTHPDDLKRIEQYNQLAQERIPLVRRFQELYGPLMHFGHAYSRFPFEWPQTPWPWQV